METLKKLGIIFIVIASCFLFTFSLESKPKEFDDYSIDGFNNYSYEYVNDFKNEFYYSHLNENEKLYYQSFYYASINNEDYFEVINSPDLNEVSNARYAFVSDWPEYFWWQGNCECKTEIVNNSIGVDYYKYKIYVLDSDEYDKSIATKNINDFVEYFYEDLEFEYQYDFALYLHNFLANYIEYDSSGEFAHNIGGSLFEQKGVCDSYARAFKLLANRAGYDCLVVYGDATNAEGTDSHAWNLIKLGDNWYHVDVTWDDVTDIDGQQLDLSFEYFLLSDDYISIDHKINDSYNYPKANDMSLYYFDMAGLSTDVYDVNEISNFLLYSLYRGADHFDIKFLNSNDCLNAFDWLNNGGFIDIFRKYRQYFNISYSIGHSEASNLVKISYEYK